MDFCKHLACEKNKKKKKQKTKNKNKKQKNTKIQKYKKNTHEGQEQNV